MGDDATQLYGDSRKNHYVAKNAYLDQKQTWEAEIWYLLEGLGSTNYDELAWPQVSIWRSTRVSIDVSNQLGIVGWFHLNLYRAYFIHLS